MTTLLAADLHLSLADPQLQPLVRLFDLAHSLRASELWILGDLFHGAWLWPSTPPLGFHRLLALVSAARHRGLTLRLLPGNHDFQLVPHLCGPGLASQLLPGVHQLSGHHIAIFHGDDWEPRPSYHVFRRLLHSSTFAGFLRTLGPRLGPLFLARLTRSAKDLRPDPLPTDHAQRRSAESLLVPPLDFLVFGHLHTPWNNLPARPLALRLGAWCLHHQAALVDSSGLHLFEAKPDHALRLLFSHPPARS